MTIALFITTGVVGVSLLGFLLYVVRTQGSLRKLENACLGAGMITFIVLVILTTLA